MVRELGSVIIENRSRQMIPLQVRRPGGDFFHEEHQIRLRPGDRTSPLPKRYFNWAQIENCRGRGDILVVEQQ